MARVEITYPCCGLSLDVKGENISGAQAILRLDKAHDLIRPDCPRKEAMARA